MATPNVLQTTTALPSPLAPDYTAVQQRGTKYGEAVEVSLVGSKTHPVSDEGSYFVATNPTPGTAIAGHAASTTLDDTKTLVYLYNGNAAGGKRIYLDYIRLNLTNAGTAGTNVRYNCKTDAALIRFSSGGTAITPVNANLDSATASGAVCKFGAVVLAAASTQARLLYGAIMRTVIGVVGDVYEINFGASDRSQGSLATAGTSIANVSVCHGPVVIGPGESFFMHQWSPSQSGAYQFEFEMGYWER